MGIVGYIVCDDERQPLCVGHGYGGDIMPRSGNMLWRSGYATLFHSRRAANRALKDGKRYALLNAMTEWHADHWHVLPLREPA